MVKISVVIPCYNAEKFIGKAIESVLSQTYSPHEIIVVDDGSTDGSVDVIKKYENKIILLQQENKGRVESRKRGFYRATGEWVALLDADDYWHPKKLEIQVQMMQGLPEDIVLIHGKDQWVGDNDIISRRIYLPSRPKYIDFRMLFQKNVIATSSVLLKRCVLNQVINFWNLGRHRAQDYGLWLLMLCHGRAFYVDQLVSYYRIHDYDSIEEIRFKVGNLAAKQNVISYIKEKRLYHLLKSVDWKRIMADTCFDIFWRYYTNEEYIQARKYLLKGLRYSFSSRYFMYICFLFICPSSIVSLLRNFLRKRGSGE